MGYIPWEVSPTQKIRITATSTEPSSTASLSPGAAGCILYKAAVPKRSAAVFLTWRVYANCVDIVMVNGEETMEYGSLRLPGPDDIVAETCSVRVGENKNIWVAFATVTGDGFGVYLAEPSTPGLWSNVTSSDVSVFTCPGIWNPRDEGTAVRKAMWLAPDCFLVADKRGLLHRYDSTGVCTTLNRASKVTRIMDGLLSSLSSTGLSYPSTSSSSGDSTVLHPLCDAVAVGFMGGGKVKNQGTELFLALDANGALSIRSARKSTPLFTLRLDKEADEVIGSLKGTEKPYGRVFLLSGSLALMHFSAIHRLPDRAGKANSTSTEDGLNARGFCAIIRYLRAGGEGQRRLVVEKVCRAPHGAADLLSATSSVTCRTPKSDNRKTIITLWRDAHGVRDSHSLLTWEPGRRKAPLGRRGWTKVDEGVSLLDTVPPLLLPSIKEALTRTTLLEVQPPCLALPAPVHSVTSPRCHPSELVLGYGGEVEGEENEGDSERERSSRIQVATDTPKDPSSALDATVAWCTRGDMCGLGPSVSSVVEALRHTGVETPFLAGSFSAVPPEEGNHRGADARQELAKALAEHLANAADSCLTGAKSELSSSRADAVYAGVCSAFVLSVLQVSHHQRRPMAIGAIGAVPNSKTVVASNCILVTPCVARPLRILPETMRITFSSLRAVNVSNSQIRTPVLPFLPPWLIANHSLAVLAAGRSLRAALHPQCLQALSGDCGPLQRSSSDLQNFISHSLSLRMEGATAGSGAAPRIPTRVVSDALSYWGTVVEHTVSVAEVFEMIAAPMEDLASKARASNSSSVVSLLHSTRSLGEWAHQRHELALDLVLSLLFLEEHSEMAGVPSTVALLLVTKIIPQAVDLLRNTAFTRWCAVTPLSHPLKMAPVACPCPSEGFSSSSGSSSSSSSYSGSYDCSSVTVGEIPGNEWSDVQGMVMEGVEVSLGKGDSSREARSCIPHPTLDSHNLHGAKSPRTLMSTWMSKCVALPVLAALTLRSWGFSMANYSGSVGEVVSSVFGRRLSPSNPFLSSSVGVSSPAIMITLSLLLQTGQSFLVERLLGVADIPCGGCVALVGMNDLMLNRVKKAASRFRSVVGKVTIPILLGGGSGDELMTMNPSLRMLQGMGADLEGTPPPSHFRAIDRRDDLPPGVDDNTVMSQRGQAAFLIGVINYMRRLKGADAAMHGLAESALGLLNPHDHALKSSLTTLAFTAALAIPDYPRAHAALTSLWTMQKRFGGSHATHPLRTLVSNVCGNRDIKALCELPFLQMRGAVCSQIRTRAMDASMAPGSQGPDIYMDLCCFLEHHGSQEVANVAHEAARRLAVEGGSCGRAPIKKILNFLLIAHRALRVASTSHAYVLVDTLPASSSGGMDIEGEDEVDDGLGGSEDAWFSSPRPGAPSILGGVKVVTRVQVDAQVALLRARLLLLKRLVHLEDHHLTEIAMAVVEGDKSTESGSGMGGMSVEEVMMVAGTGGWIGGEIKTTAPRLVSLLTSSGLHGDAITLARATGVPMMSIFEDLGAMVAKVQCGEARDEGYRAVLQKLLQRFCSSRGGSDSQSIGVATLRGICGGSRHRPHIPPVILSIVSGVAPEACIRLLCEDGRLEEALGVAHSVTSGVSGSTSIPHILIQQLLTLMGRVSETHPRYSAIIARGESLFEAVGEKVRIAMSMKDDVEHKNELPPKNF